MSKTAIVYRLLLVALLPVVGLTIYVTGQRYDPGLMDFKSARSLGEGGAINFPREAAGFQLRGLVRTFNKDNLFEYVNGHAEYLINNGFVALYVAEYVATGIAEGHSPDVVPDVVIDVYVMGKLEHAFGVLMDSAPSDNNEVQVGLMGYKTENGVSFFAGSYYVHVTTFKEQSEVVSLAGAIHDALGVRAGTFSLFDRLPDIGKVVSTRYFKENYRGIDFIHNVIERRYEIDGTEVQVALVTGGKDVVDSLVSAFMAYFEKSGVTYGKSEVAGVICYKIVDKYEGDWFLIPSGDALFGVYGAVSDELAAKVIAKMKN
ncbi:MAG: hypothetical protein HQL05_14555 [Nitrospirae bacterium]|uniref:DUF6599 family protein n=1 Tax=Candidatus Magnetobacterium casense TaxID=1455061 RepID=UPI00058C0939|nr:DUF6599 family protein [Candidatus Magnetobacterium casensis]MBF0339036.1 hypothetical protein [Nitrospirota bacterium]